MFGERERLFNLGDLDLDRLIFLFLCDDLRSASSFSATNLFKIKVLINLAN